jgi:hypothetical protein
MGARPVGEVIVLRDDFQPDTSGDMDLGYSRLVKDNRGEWVGPYYGATRDHLQPHIAATIWRAKSKWRIEG